MTDYQPFEWTQRVPYAYTDAQGRMFYANYFLVADEARYAFWERGLDLGAQAVVDIEHSFFLVHIECDYHGAAMFYDLLNIQVIPRDLGRSSLGLDYRISRGGEALFHAATTVVWSDRATERPAPWPESVRAALIAHRGGAVLRR